MTQSDNPQGPNYVLPESGHSLTIAEADAQNAAFNAALARGDVAEVERLNPLFTLWNGALVRKDQLQALQNSGATVQNGQVIGPSIPSEKKPENIIEGTSSNAPLASAIDTPLQSQVSPIGFSLSGSNLKLGSAGGDVKALQQYLSALGIYQGKVDGIFGPQTQSAVQQFQSSHGLTADGIVGPKTVSAIQAVQGGQSAPASSLATKAPDDPSNQFNTATGQPNPNYNPNGTSGAYSTGNPEQDALLTQLSEYINDLTNKGYTINPALNINDNTISQFLTQAQKEIHPYYSQQIEGLKQQLSRDLGQTTDQYGNEVANQEANFEQNLGNTRENYAGNGLAFSGARGKGELGMQSVQNRTLAGLSSQYGNQLSNTVQTAEQKLGASNLAGFKLPDLSNYSASLEGNGGFNTTSTASTYKPGTYQIGSIPAEENQATQTYKNQLLSEAYKRADNGLSYNDLIK